ncbi:DUF1656 domain-containing protein [Halomonas caseinilytica]|uniref:DUF1656 domain-containing protein n=1 Tax=Halomonas caseinilytica TaxID=438744 RepID=A0A1M6MG47_9GAMM|nr:DUF1656 domain-containing protein [Halomonas caseinilytica]SEM39752.1 Protein of unknown function [Halomonas caseinilytica]SHJ82407.1 Protein of unknown function [Halomonas caseinilytica]
MGLREIAAGGIYLSPMLIYALLGLVCALLIRSILHRLVGSTRLWFEAWFDTALFVICTAAIAYLSSAAVGTL